MPGPNGEAVDHPVLVVRANLDLPDFQFVQLLQKPERQQRRVHERGVVVNHHEHAVDVQTVAGEMNAQQLHALRAQHILKLARAFLIDPARQPDDGDLPFAESASRGWRAFGSPAAPPAADRRTEPRDNGATIDGDDAVPRVDGLHLARRAFVDIDDLCALVSQCIGECIMLCLLGCKIRDRVAAPVPSFRRITEGADVRQPLAGVDDIQFGNGAMHEYHAKLADIVIAAPSAPPESAP
jgi:hypothetical protein